MLELKNLSLRIENEKEILKDVHMEVSEGKLVVITGPNGGGKSSLAKVIAGIVTPNTGSILFEGEDITGLSISERARLGIGFAFQQPVRFKGITVHDLINLAAGSDLSQTQACGYLGEVGLCTKDYIDREVNASLSGGEIKRIEIALLMARKAKLSIFDEPEAGIDLWSFNNLIDVFKKMRREIKGSILIISHQERILEIADEIIVLADGKIVASGPREEILPQLTGDTDRCRFCPRKDEDVNE